MFLINFLGFLFIIKSMNKIYAYDFKKKKAGWEFSTDSGYNVGGWKELVQRLLNKESYLFRPKRKFGWAGGFVVEKTGRKAETWNEYCDVKLYLF